MIVSRGNSQRLLESAHSSDGTRTAPTGSSLSADVSGMAKALVEDRRAAETAAWEAKCYLETLFHEHSESEDEKVLTLAEAMAQEEAAEEAAAVEAANAGREEWEECFTEDGTPYYVHYQTGESVWEKPSKRR
mgnify:CR=1 FL=1